MKIRTAFALVAALALALAVPAVASMDGSWTGWITDTHCGAKGAKAEHADCAKKCASGGAKLVLFNNADQKLYALDKQDEAMKHLGHEVTVKGSVDGEAIAVESIEAAAAK